MISKSCFSARTDPTEVRQPDLHFGRFGQGMHPKTGECILEEGLRELVPAHGAGQSSDAEHEPKRRRTGDHNGGCDTGLPPVDPVVLEQQPKEVLAVCLGDDAPDGHFEIAVGISDQGLLEQQLQEVSAVCLGLTTNLGEGTGFPRPGPSRGPVFQFKHRCFHTGGI